MKPFNKIMEKNEEQVKAEAIVRAEVIMKVRNEVLDLLKTKSMVVQDAMQVLKSCQERISIVLGERKLEDSI